VKRRLFVVAFVFVVVAGVLTLIGAIKFKQIQAAAVQASSYVPPPETVTTIIARRDEWKGTLGAIGSVMAVHGVNVSADLPGIVERIDFESGQMVREGDILVQLDARQETAQHAAAIARRDLARASLERMRGLMGKGVASQAEFDVADADARQAEARVAELAAAIARKTIRAPFAGLLGIRHVNRGQYMADGDTVVSLQSLHPVYVDFAVPQQELARLRLGGTVTVKADGLPEAELTGRISAMDSIIEQKTRNLTVRATLANRGDRLRPGMFVSIQVGLAESNALIALPASAISYAPYGNSVFIVEEMKGPDGRTFRGVRQQFVQLGGGRGDQISVTSGVEEGQEVVTSGAFKLRNGAAVVVNNDVVPANDPAPAPEDS